VSSSRSKKRLRRWELNRMGKAAPVPVEVIVLLSSISGIDLLLGMIL
jgi:hypothetical protein